MAKLKLRYGAISTDDHIQESPDLWTDRMSAAAFGEAIPHVIERDDGSQTWLINGELFPRLAMVPAAMPNRRIEPLRWEDVPKATYVPGDRLKAMDHDSVDTHAFFPNIAGLTGGTFTNRGTEDWREACIRAYNDWLIDVWAEYSPRFIAQCIAPMWDVDKAVAEVRRSAKRGHKALVWHGALSNLDLPHFNDAYWDPLYATCQELDLPMALHIGAAGMLATWDGYAPYTAKALGSAAAIASNVQILANLLYSGVPERFPKLNFISVESGIGWIPYLLETLDHEYEVLECWKDGMSRKPSEYFHRQVYANFWYEHVGIEIRRHVGVDRILWETDYPHTTSTYPNSKTMRESCLAGVPDEERRAMLVDNSVRLFKLDIEE